MTRHETERLLSYAEGTLSPECRLEVQRHLAQCPGCRGELETLASLVHTLDRAPSALRPIVQPGPARWHATWARANRVSSAPADWGLSLARAAAMALLLVWANVLLLIQYGPAFPASPSGDSELPASTGPQATASLGRTSPPGYAGEAETPWVTPVPNPIPMTTTAPGH